MLDINEKLLLKRNVESQVLSHFLQMNDIMCYMSSLGFKSQILSHYDAWSVYSMSILTGFTKVVHVQDLRHFCLSSKITLTGRDITELPPNHLHAIMDVVARSRGI